MTATLIVLILTAAAASAVMTVNDILNLLVYLFTSFTLHILLTLHASSTSSILTTSTTSTMNTMSFKYNILFKHNALSKHNASSKHNITFKVQLKLIILQKSEEQIQLIIYLYIDIKLTYRTDIYSVIIKYKIIINISTIRFCHCHIKKVQRSVNINFD